MNKQVLFKIFYALTKAYGNNQAAEIFEQLLTMISQ